MLETGREYEVHDAERIGRIRLRELETGVQSREIAEGDREAADYFARFMDNLTYLVSLSTDPSFIGASDAQSNTVAYTNGESIHYLGWSIARLNKTKLLHTHSHEKEHINCTCSSCELFKELSPDHRATLYRTLGFVADLDGREMDEGMVEAKIQRRMGDNLGAYPDYVKVAQRLQEVVQKELGISLFQLHTAAQKGEMARVVKMLANKLLFKEVLAEGDYSPQEIEYCTMTMISTMVHVRAESKEDMSRIVKKMIGDYREIGMIQSELQ